MEEKETKKENKGANVENDKYEIFHQAFDILVKNGKIYDALYYFKYPDGKGDIGLQYKDRRNRTRILFMPIALANEKEKEVIEKMPDDHIYFSKINRAE
jgi:hypothetical protein